MRKECRKEWMVMAWCLTLLWGATSGAFGQQQQVTEPEVSAAVAEGDQSEEALEASSAENGEPGTEDLIDAPDQSVFAGIRRLLREQQRHLTGSAENTGLPPLGGILALFLVAYVVIVLGVLTFWRRSHKPTFRQQRLEQIRGAGRWTSAIAYTIRRKVDARIELRMTKVEPEGIAADLACLVDGNIKGRFGPDAAAFLDFPGLKPRSFWQKDQQEVIPLGFELIQPRDRPITLHIEVRVEYSIGNRQGTGGEFRQTLEFKPAKESGLLSLTSSDSNEASARGFTAQQTPFSDPKVMPLPPPVSAPNLAASTQLGDRAAEAASLAAERALSTLDEFQRQRQELDRRLTTLETQEKEASGTRDGGGRGREIKALEERLGSDLRENIQAIMEQVDDLRAEVASLRALVSDLAQRVP